MLRHIRSRDWDGVLSDYSELNLAGQQLPEIARGLALCSQRQHDGCQRHC